MADEKNPYFGKVFYEILPISESGKVSLVGPLKDIRFVQAVEGGPKANDYKFVQVVDGKPVVAFREHEILVVDRVLGSA
jgi:hypothetical protein